MGRKANPNKVIRTNTIPSGEKDRARLYCMVKEAVDSKVRQAAEAEQFVSVRDTALENFAITSKLFNRLVSWEFKANFDKTNSEFQELAIAYENLKGSGES